MSGFPYYMVLKSSRLLTRQAFLAIGMAVIDLTENSEADRLTRKFDDFEIFLQRTGKYGFLGSFGGHELNAVYADEDGYEVRVTFLANIQRIVGSSDQPN